MSSSSRASRKELRGIAWRVMIERGLRPEFSPEVWTETQAIGRAAVEADQGIRDLRGLLWASIDNDDSRDLDQLSAAESMPGGAVRVRIAIADVDALVRKGSAIDGHARANTTSVYTAAEIFPMLPEKLSTDLSSLNPGEERLAIVIEMILGPEGVVGESALYRARVVNRAKLAYNAVAAWLEGEAAAPAALAEVPGLEDSLRLQDRVAQSMKSLRHQHGALTLETIEARPVYDGEYLSDLRPDEKNRAKELIENFMVAANGVTAKFLEKRGFPTLRRVLRSPERWDRIVELARPLGGVLPASPDGLALEVFLAKRLKADPAAFPDLSLSVVKLLGRGEYVLVAPGGRVDGHFGLAVKHYTHSTAPNRRFPDLLTQRLLKAALADRPAPYTLDELNALATHCTAQEDNATKAERQIAKSAAAILLRPRIGERFNAMVTGASHKGTWVRISHPTVEGKLVHSGGGLDVGDRVSVKLIEVDVERGYIDFAQT